MNKDSTSYFESEEFKELLFRYEDVRDHRLSSYFDPDQLADISEYYMSQGKYQTAHETIDYALYLHPGNSGAMVIKARLLLDEDKIDEALQIANAVKDNSDYEVILLKAEILLIQEKPEEAENLLRQYLDIEGKEKEYYIDIAYLFLDNGLPLKAISWFEEASNSFPNDSEITEGLAESCFEAEQPGEAIRYYNLLLDENPYSTDYWSELGKIYFTTEEFNKAIEAYEFVIAIDKENRHAILMLGHCYAKLENYPKAEEYYKSFSDNSNKADNEHSYYYLGICYYSMGDYKKAIDSFLKGIELDGELIFQPLDIYTYISECYGELGDKENALRYIDLAISEDPDIADSYYSKIKLLLKTGDPDGAYQVMSQTISKALANIPDILEAGILFANYREYEQALAIFELLENTFPLAYHIFTAFVHHSNGNQILYKTHINEAMMLSPEGFWKKLKDHPEKDIFALMKIVLLEIYETNN